MAVRELTRKYLLWRVVVGNCKSAASALLGAHIHRRLQGTQVSEHFKTDF